MASSLYVAVVTVGNDTITFSQTKTLGDPQTTYLLYLYYKHLLETAMKGLRAYRWE